MRSGGWASGCGTEGAGYFAGWVEELDEGVAVRGDEELEAGIAVEVGEGEADGVVGVAVKGEALVALGYCLRRAAKAAARAIVLMRVKASTIWGVMG